MSNSPRSLTLPVVACAAALLPATLSAQQVGEPDTDPARSGVHFSVGLGAGSASASCPGCDVDFFDDRLAGLSGVLQIGFFATPRLAVTGEFTGWMKNDDPVYRRMAGLAVSLLGYPSDTGGFFVKGSVGGLRAIAENDALRVQTDAWMAITGFGYDVPLGGSTAVTMYANYVRAFGGATWVNGFSSDLVVTPDALQVGVGLTVH